MKDLSVIILHHNTPKLTRDCLNSIFAETRDLDLEVLVVDNASTDGSGEVLSREFPQVEFLRSDKPLGFSAGNNLALRQARGRYLLILNSDTLIVDRALNRAVEYLEKHPEAALLGVRLVLPNGRFDPACHRSFPTPGASFHKMLGLSKLFPRSRFFARYNLTYLPEDGIYPVDSISGAFMMGRREILQEIDFFCEDFDFYGEDLDICFRLQEKGYRVHYNGKIHIIHLKGGSTDQFSSWIVRNFHDSMYLFYRKHFARRYPRPLNQVIYTAILMRRTWFLARAAYKRFRYQRFVPPDRIVLKNGNREQGDSAS